MSKRAEEKALEAYPIICCDGEEQNSAIADDLGSFDFFFRNVFKEGYEQAEKDLALTVEDIKTIIHLYGIVCEERTFDTIGEIYEEVLRRFNKAKEK